MWICVRKTLQNVIESTKVGKNVINENLIILVSYYNLRRLGSSRVRTTNSYVGGSNPLGRTNDFKDLS